MELSIKITPNLTELYNRLKGDVNGGMRAGMVNLVADIEARATKKAPVRTSNLANSHTNVVTADGLRGMVKFTAQYAKFVHEGTGLYGPHKKRIVPLKAKALNIPGIGYRKSTRGQKPNPFLRDAALEVNPPALFSEGMMNYIRKRGW